MAMAVPIYTRIDLAFPFSEIVHRAHKPTMECDFMVDWQEAELIRNR